MDAGLACLNRQRRQEFSGEFRKTADLGRFNLWRPMVVERIRGSNRLSALPTGSRWLSALPTRPDRTDYIQIVQKD